MFAVQTKKAAKTVEMDWWSKYYASKGETDKSMNYVEHGYDKLQVRVFHRCKIVFFYFFYPRHVFDNLYSPRIYNR